MASALGERGFLVPIVVLQPGSIVVETRENETVLDAIRRSGYSVPYSCRRGGCGVCKAQIVDGRVDYPKRVATSVLGAAEKASGTCLTCRAVPITNVVIRLPGGDPRRILPFVWSVEPGVATGPLKEPHEGHPV